MFLCDWFKKHILKDDRKFTIYVSKSKNDSFTMPTVED
jgi:hemerythrin